MEGEEEESGSVAGTLLAATVGGLGNRKLKPARIGAGGGSSRRQRLELTVSGSPQSPPGEERGSPSRRAHWSSHCVRAGPLPGSRVGLPWAGRVSLSARAAERRRALSACAEGFARASAVERTGLGWAGGPGAEQGEDLADAGGEAADSSPLLRLPAAAAASPLQSFGREFGRSSHLGSEPALRLLGSGPRTSRGA